MSPERRGEREPWSYVGGVRKELVYMPSIEAQSFMHLSTRGDTYALRTFRGGRPEICRHVPGCENTDELLAQHPAQFSVDVSMDGRRIDDDEYWTARTKDLNEAHGLLDVSAVRPTAYLSCADEDMEYALGLARELSGRGVDVTIGESGGGAEVEEMERNYGAIHECDCFVAVASDAYERSARCRQELQYLRHDAAGSRRTKTVLCVRLGDIATPPPLQHEPTVDGSVRTLSDDARQLVSAIAAHGSLGSGPSVNVADPAYRPASQPPASRGERTRSATAGEVRETLAAVPADEIDLLAAEAFPAFIVRKDLARRFTARYRLPTYVVESLLGKYCATSDQSEIAGGLEVVQRMLSERVVQEGDETLSRARLREHGRLKVIGLITARLDSKTDAYLAAIPSLRLRDCRVDRELMEKNERVLTGGLYAEIDLEYDLMIAEFSVVGIKPIQMSVPGAVERLAEGRRKFTTEQWKWLLLRSTGIEPGMLSERERDVLLLRMVPFVVRNYNAVEFGPHGTGKAYLYREVSPYAHLPIVGRATVAQILDFGATGQRAPVCQYDVICFHDSGVVSFDWKDGVSVMKAYMEAGEFSRGTEIMPVDSSLVFVDTFDVDVRQQPRVGHLLRPLPEDMRDDTAFMDRLHAYVPGWDAPRLSADHFTDHLGLVSDFIAEYWSQLRAHSLPRLWRPRVQFGDALSERDTWAASKTADGLLKLLHPGAESPPPDEDIEWAVRLALESRRRIKEQQKCIDADEFGNTQFSYALIADGVEHVVGTPESSGDG